MDLSTNPLKEMIQSCPKISDNILNPSVAYFNQGNFFVSEDNLTLAIASYTKAIECNPSFAEAYFNIGSIIANTANMSDIVSKNSKDQADQVAYKNKALEYTHEAIKAFQKAVCLRPSFAEAYFQLGNAKSKLDYLEAIPLWRKAIALKPDFAEAYIEISKHLFWIENKVEEALQNFEQALKLQPDRLQAYDETSFYIKHSLDGEVDDAIKSHNLKKEDRRKQRSAALQLDQLPIRMLTGIHQSIGHYYYLDGFAKFKALGLLPNLQMIVVASENEIINPCLLGYWKKYFPIITDPIVLKSLAPLEKYLEGQYSDVKDFSEKFFSDEYKLTAKVQMQWEKENRPPLLKISDRDYERGRDCLQRLGVPQEAWFVCLHVRDNGYKGHSEYEELRNVDIKTYFLTIQSIVERGGWVIRIGDAKMAPLPPLPHVVDYAHSDQKSDWMDVFLWSQCRFFIGSNSGPTQIPISFGVPCVRTNSIALTRIPVSQNELIIPKLFWSELEKRYFTFKEIVDPAGDIQWTHNIRRFSEKGITPVHSTPEELNDVVLEMLDRVEGKDTYTDEDLRLQKRFATMVKDTCSPYKQNDLTSPIGKRFLQKYANLL